MNGPFASIMFIRPRHGPQVPDKRGRRRKRYNSAMRYVEALALTTLIVAVAGCGQKGPLVLPDKRPQGATVTKPIPATVAPAPAEAPLQTAPQ
jgi:predicted small lipoprotein YifL